MSLSFKLYLFGDQTFDVRSPLRDLLANRDNPVLQSFLAEAYKAIRAEVSSLPLGIREQIPRFTCLEDLISNDGVEKPSLSVDMALTCLYQVAAFIRQHDFSAYTSVDSRAAGLCTGALAAAAVSCNSSTLEVVKHGVAAVRVAFRIGLRVAEAAKQIVGVADESETWSVLLSGSDCSEKVEMFCEKNEFPLTSKPYISAYSRQGVTVSGPANSLALLLDSKELKGVRSKELAIPGPFHASHLYCETDIDRILDGIIDEPGTAGHREQLLPISSASPQGHGPSFPLLLRDAIARILLRPLEWPKLLQELEGCLEKTKPDSFTIVPVATSAHHLVSNELRNNPLCPPIHLVDRAHDKAQSSTSSRGKNPKLAIIGMSGRFPGAKSTDAFWDLLYEGLDVHRPVPSSRWDAATHVDPTGVRKNTSATPFGCWLDDPGDFDARFFNISPREAPQIDPAQRIALMTTYEAIEQAGLVPDATLSTQRDRIGVFFGVTSNDWMETNSAQNIDTYFIPGGNRAFIPGRINYFFKFSGPSYAVDTACSSSLASIYLACNALWQGDVDTVIAGGTNVLTNPDMTAGLDKGHFLSRTGNCKTFDDSADGYCRGEGVGTVIIKRLDDALADKDPILGVILGSATNHSAESESITRPHTGAQEAVFKSILKQGGVDAQSVSYVEMHGTGTQAGDGGEMSSVLKTFAPAPGAVKHLKGRSSSESLYLGSAKANIGHGEASSGVSSLIKVLLMMQKDTIVPHCGIKTQINHRFPRDLDSRNVHIALKPTAWPKITNHSSGPRRAFVNNFSAAGGNTALLLEDAPRGSYESAVADLPPDPRTHHLVAVSAKNGVSLQGNLRSLLRYLQENPGVPLGQLSYTTTARRSHYPHRVMLSGRNVDELCAGLDNALTNNHGVNRPKSPHKVIFAFTGQGAQYPGMGKHLLENTAFHHEMCRLDQIVQTLGFPSVMPLIQSDERDLANFPPTAVQLANSCLQIALAKLWASWGIRPAAVVGHSLGEYAALNAAGVLSDSDTIFLVGSRAKILEEKCTKDTHSMLVINGTVDKIAGVLGHVTDLYEVACINSPTETVISGLEQSMARCKEILTDAGVRSTLLAVPYAFHSSQMDPILDDLRRIASAVTFCKAQLPVLCPLDGRIVDAGKEAFGPEYLAAHSRQPVNMLQALLEARNNSILTDQTTVLEIGPHPAVSGMIKSGLGSQINCVASLQRGKPGWQVLSTTLRTMYQGGADICWQQYHTDFQQSHKVLQLPTYNWDLKNYWLQYVNDWSLRKGDPPANNAYSGLESTTIHRVVEETGDSKSAHLIIESDITRKDLSPLVQGHEVDGIPLCTPSVYADIGLSIGSYLLRRYLPDQQGSLVDVSDMVISKALILRADATQQLLQAHAEANWVENTVAVKFVSFDNRQKLQQHASCTLRFKDKATLLKLSDDAPQVKQRMNALREGITTGTTARYNRPMVYRAIRPLARFHDDYRAIDEVVLNSTTLEASSQLSFGTIKRAGSYHTHPAIIDALSQSCGFTMNCNDNSDLDVEVHMNHGWGSLSILEPIAFNKVYSTYTKMSEGADKLWHGDVFVFDGDKVVAHMGQVAIQAVPRRVLKVILSIESGGATQKKTLKSSPAAKPQHDAHKSSNDKLLSSSSTSLQALEIISEESGVAISDLTDSTVFADLGVDSLLGLTIAARFKEELNVDLDHSMLFFEYPTVASLKKFLSGTSSPNHGADTISSGSTAPTESITTGATTPDSKATRSEEFDFQQALNIISEESGLSLEDLTDDTNFADAGVDSLLSLVVTSRFRDELDLDIQNESLFLECSTVRDLKTSLFGEPSIDLNPPEPAQEAQPLPDNPATTAATILDARKNAVDELVAKYSQGFSVDVANLGSSATLKPRVSAKVVLVTGASGSLGSNLVYHLAQLPDVEKVVCLNRENKADPDLRQQKAMRAKGIRFPEHLKPKLSVIQTDSAKPMFGLPRDVYEELSGSVTHLIHNAWPMSAKRDLAGFETQFQVMRRLVDFASDAVSRHEDGFVFSFQLVSSIGVVGLYGSGGDGKDIPDQPQRPAIRVPEERVDIDSVLPNGYGQAKWGCERMLDATLRQQPHAGRFRAMVVRLGQIAGSSKSGYWNPMEHFGFLVKSSQTLGALPEAPKHAMAYWTPVDQVAGALSDLVLGAADGGEPHAVYHIENPVGQPWRDLNDVLAGALDIKERVPFREWLARVRAAPQHGNPAATLIEFLEENYLKMSCGGLVLDVKNTLQHSPTLSGTGPVGEDVVRKYIHVWKEIGFLA